MKKEKLYHYSDFTYHNYRKLLNLAKKYYIFRFYNNYNPDENFLLWRHDVDMSPQSALKLSKIEKEEGVVSTYFFHLHSIFYNLLEEEVMSIAHDIIKMGHAIGLHFEPEIFKLESDQVFLEKLSMEKKLFESFFEYKIHAFSFHNPSQTILKKYVDYKYAGLINTYSSYFQNEVGYCSDSNGYWRHRRLADVLRSAEDERLQVLTHPVWWQDEVMSPHQRIQRCIDGRAANQQKRYDKIISKMGRLNVR